MTPERLAEIKATHREPPTVLGMRCDCRDCSTGTTVWELVREVERLREQKAKLRMALFSARLDIDYWADYAGEYIKDKYLVQRNELAYITEALEETKP